MKDENLERAKMSCSGFASSSAYSSSDSSDDIHENIENETRSDSSFLPNFELRENNQNRFTYNKLSVTAERYSVSSRAAAAIVNAALEDMGILNQGNILDRKKVEREKKKIEFRKETLHKFRTTTLCAFVLMEENIKPKHLQGQN